MILSGQSSEVRPSIHAEPSNAENLTDSGRPRLSNGCLVRAGSHRRFGRRHSLWEISNGMRADRFGGTAPCRCISRRPILYLLTCSSLGPKKGPDPDLHHSRKTDRSLDTISYPARSVRPTSTWYASCASHCSEAATTMQMSQGSPRIGVEHWLRYWYPYLQDSFSPSH